MNYYNPYFYSLPETAINTSKTGVFARLFGKSGLTLSGILSGTQKVLGVANQAIPLVKQVRPMIGNAKTMFKIMNEFNRTDSKSKNNSFNQPNKINNNYKNNSVNQANQTDIMSNSDNNKTIDYNNGLTFFA